MNELNLSVETDKGIKFTLAEGIKDYDCVSFDFQGSGSSEGTTSAAVVLLYAAKYNDILFVINIFSPYNYSKTLAKIFTAEQLKEMENLDMAIVKNINRISTNESLTVHGDNDEICPIDCAFIYNKLLGSEPYHKLAFIN
ncbi:9529_t:CDS:2, partial [Gigaspora margarita]